MEKSGFVKTCDENVPRRTEKAEASIPAAAAAFWSRAALPMSVMLTSFFFKMSLKLLRKSAGLTPFSLSCSLSSWKYSIFKCEWSFFLTNCAFACFVFFYVSSQVIHYWFNILEIHIQKSGRPVNYITLYKAFRKVYILHKIYIYIWLKKIILLMLRIRKNLCFWHVISQLGIVKFDEISKLEIPAVSALCWLSQFCTLKKN